MSLVLKFRMLSDEDDNFLRDYEIPYGSTLLDLHNFICRDLRYDNGELASFFTSDRDWNKLMEFTLIDMGDDMFPSMEATPLSAVIAQNNDRLIYQFDMINDRALYLELMQTLKSDRTEPEVVFIVGEAPDQFNTGMPKVSRSIFDEAMSDFDDFGGDDNYSDDDR